MLGNSWKNVLWCEARMRAPLFYSFYVWDVCSVGTHRLPRPQYHSTHCYCYWFPVNAEPRINIAPLRPILKHFVPLISNKHGSGCFVLRCKVARGNAALKQSGDAEGRYDAQCSPSFILKTSQIQSRGFFFFSEKKLCAVRRKTPLDSLQEENCRLCEWIHNLGQNNLSSIINAIIFYIICIILNSPGVYFSSRVP